MRKKRLGVKFEKFKDLFNNTEADEEELEDCYEELEDDSDEEESNS